MITYSVLIRKQGKTYNGIYKLIGVLKSINNKIDFCIFNTIE